MSRRALAICVLLAIHPVAGQAQSNEDELVKDYAKTLARDRDAKDRADAARSLGGRKSPVAPLCRHPEERGDEGRRTRHGTLSIKYGAGESAGLVRSATRSEQDGTAGLLAWPLAVGQIIGVGESAFPRRSLASDLDRAESPGPDLEAQASRP